MVWRRASWLANISLGAVRVALCGVVMLGTLAVPAGAIAGPPSTATVVFGSDGNLLGSSPTRDCAVASNNLGKPTCLGRDHDQSNNALHNIHPGTAVIADDGTITFINAGGNHQVAVYAPGTDVRALQAAVVVGSGFFNIDNAAFDRVYLGPQPWAAGPGGAVTTPGGPGGTFGTPGRYLLVCTNKRHLVEWDQYGWVIVQ